MAATAALPKTRQQLNAFAARGEELHSGADLCRRHGCREFAARQTATSGTRVGAGAEYFPSPGKSPRLVVFCFDEEFSRLF
jgi:hypothetical protein